MAVRVGRLKGMGWGGPPIKRPKRKDCTLRLLVGAGQCQELRVKQLREKCLAGEDNRDLTPAQQMHFGRNMCARRCGACDASQDSVAQAVVSGRPDRALVASRGQRAAGQHQLEA